MSKLRPYVGPLVIVACLALVGLKASRPSFPEVTVAAFVQGARYESARALPAPAALRFDRSVAPSDQQVVRRVIAEARPDARRLVDLVAGIVTVSVGPATGGTAGWAAATRDGYEVRLDLGGIYRSSGMRGVRRLVLHELAHVVDHALVPSALEAQLDAATPPGFGCDDGRTGGCAARGERFAESFAKWATGDVGHDLYIGYRVPPPISLAGWGEPLAELTR